MAKDASAPLVTVFEGGDPAALAVVKSLLDGAGIKYLTKGEGVQNLIGIGQMGAGFNPLVGPVEIRVVPKDVERAQAALRALDFQPEDPEDGKEAA